jgi:sporulation protein YlmC with PRC-barrel domain
MQENKRILNVEKDLKGMSVIKVDSGSKMGEVTGAVVHPIEGKMLGVIIRTSEDKGRILLTENFFIGADAIMADAKARFEEIPSPKLEGGVPALAAIIGTNLVTEEGRLVGRVSEVHISTKKPFAVYKVAESTLQIFFGGGFYIPAYAVRAYSDDGVRMVVPANIEDGYGTSSPEDAMAMWEQAAKRTRAGAR